MSKKIISVVIAFTVSIFSLFAVPGFESYLPDKSGTYVYYRDYTFNRESYIGILIYDEATYQIKYYAPKDEKQLLPPKEIAILLTVNPDANFWEMTGERILTAIMPETEDIDIVNYLHDFLYEFSARRNKVEFTPGDEDYVWCKAFWENGFKSKQEYAQFGGSVYIYFDSLIPLFNIKRIVSESGTISLETCVIGELKSDNDKSFDSFIGIQNYDFDLDTRKSETYKKAKSVKHTCENHTVTIDENWQFATEAPNFCTLNNDSVITMMTIPQFSKDQMKNDLFTLSGYLKSVYCSYVNLKTVILSYDEKNACYKLSFDSFEPNLMNNHTSATELFTRNTAGGFDCFTINTYKKPWQQNQGYFNKIVKSYK